MRGVALGAVVLAGCSSPSPDLTCALLASSSNCFAESVVTLAACMPMRASPAVLSSDHLTCTFSDGVYVAFNNPIQTLQVHVNDPGGIRFIIHAPDASECGELYYVENSGDVLAVAYGSDGSQGARWETPTAGFSTYYLHCGARTLSSDPNNELACQPPAVMPGFQYSTTAPYKFSVDSAAGIASPFFTCQ